MRKELFTIFRFKKGKPNAQQDYDQDKDRINVNAVFRKSFHQYMESMESAGEKSNPNSREGQAQSDQPQPEKVRVNATNDNPLGDQTAPCDYSAPQGKREESRSEAQRIKEEQAALLSQKIPPGIDECEKLVKQIFNNSFDIVVQPFQTRKERAMVVYVDGLADKGLVDRDIISHLKSVDFDGNAPLAIKAGYKQTQDLASFVSDVLGGFVGIFYQDSQAILVVELRQWSQRAVEEPTAEAIIRGPKEGFTESIRVNTSLLRRKIKNPNLIIENYTFGRQTNTLVELAYIKGIVNRDVLQEIKWRLGKIDVDAILESGHIEQYICENTYAPISGIGLTQRPDKAAYKLLEGRVAVFCDGTPHVLIIPEMFIENIQTGEDYYSRTVIAGMIRILRFAGLFITVLLPGLTAAVLTYHQEMIPAQLLASIIQSMMKTPLATWAEILLMMVLFELIKEAGVRLPLAVGSAISIVGSLIVGQAAVEAGLVSGISVIVVAISAVCSFIVSDLNEFTWVHRLLYWFLGSTMGLIGIGTGMIISLTQLISTDSFGIPILSNFSKSEMKDSFIRFPLKKLKYRSDAVVKDNVKKNNMEEKQT